MTASTFLHLEGRKTKWIALGFGVLALLGLCLRCHFFQISVNVLQPSSDESITMLLAQRVRQGGWPLLFLAQPYLFPLVSYLIAPFSTLLPPDAFGARLPIFFLHLLALATQLWLLVKFTRSILLRFAGAALLLFPSCYVLMIQSAYSMPGYASMAMGGFLIIAFAHQSTQSARPLRWLFSLGLLGGLIYATHQLVLVFLLPALYYALTAASHTPKFRRVIAATCGLASGLFPYFLASQQMPGAHAAVEKTVPVGRMVAKMWEPGLTYTLQGALGWRIPPFPDESLLPAYWNGMGPWTASLLLIALFASAGILLINRLRPGTNRRWAFQLGDVFASIFALNILFFAASARATGASYRYLLPAALAFPFLIVAMADRWPRSRPLLLTCTALLLVVNLLGAQRLLDAWRAPDFANRVAGIPDLNPALAYLQKQGIHHAVASYGAAYRINFQSAGAVACAQPYNERFQEWPLPFLKKVWAGKRIAYVLTERIRFLKPSVFERHLRTMGVTALVETAGYFRVYHDFTPGYDEEHSSLLPASGLRVAASEAARPIAHLIDGDPLTIWTTTNTMRGGEWLEVTWPAARPLNRFVLLHGIYTHDVPRSYRLLLHQDGEWKIWQDKNSAELDKFELLHGHPKYGRATRTFRLNGERADGVRIEVTEPRTNRNWTLAEIEVYVQGAGGTETPAAGAMTL